MPRPRSEEIPLEDVRLKQRRENILLSGMVNSRFNGPRVSSVPGPSTSAGNAVVLSFGATEPIPSEGEETSFTESADEEKQQRRKGQVETV